MEKTTNNLEDLVQFAFNYSVLEPDEKRGFNRKLNEDQKRLKQEIKKIILLIPRTMLNDYLRNNNFYISVNTLSKNYSSYFVKDDDSRRNYIEFDNAIKLMNHLWKRKYLIENGRRLEDLNNELGLNRKYEALLNRYKKLHDNGIIKLYLLPKVDEFGNTPRQSSSYVFDEEDYGKVVAFELREKILKNMHENKEVITISEFADSLNITRNNASRLLRRRKKGKGINFYDLETLSGRIIQTYVDVNKVLEYHLEVSNDKIIFGKLFSSFFPFYRSFNPEIISILREANLIKNNTSLLLTQFLKPNETIHILEKSNVPLEIYHNNILRNFLTNWRDGECYKNIVDSFVDKYKKDNSFKNKVDELLKKYN